jgi:hypothetical protein
MLWAGPPIVAAKTKAYVVPPENPDDVSRGWNLSDQESLQGK